MTLIKNWRAAPRLLSVQIAAATAAVAALEPVVPALQAALPPAWAAYASLAIALARVVQQPAVSAPDAPGAIVQGVGHD